MMRDLALVVALVGWLTPSAAAQTATLVEAGRQVYASKQCARCHMVAGRGYKNGKLDGVASKMSADDMRRWLTAPLEMEAKLDKKPKVKMSSRKTMHLTDSDVTALVAYLRTLK
jgi:mono/diheme cytochrome c family protein